MADHSAYLASAVFFACSPAPLPAAMLQLTVLGPVRLHAPDGRVLSSILSQPKRTALLAYLALARPRGMQRRDVVLSLFWPELPDDRARANLSNALYNLRRSLSAGALVSRGDDEVGFAEGAVACDALAFERAVEEGRDEEALEAYAGDLLAGFHLDDAPGWERWLDEERARLRRLAAGAMHRVTARLAEAGDEASLRGAAGWARRALELDPFDEPAARALVRALDRLGDRGGAEQAYQAFAARLWDELELEPSPETRLLAESVRSRSVVVALPEAAEETAPVPVEAAQVIPAAAAPDEATPVTDGAARAQPPVPDERRRGPVPVPPLAGRSWSRPRARRWAASAALAVLFTSASSAAYTVWQRPAPFRAAPERGRVAVLPFAVRGDTGAEHLGPGVADLLAARLDGRDSLHTVDPAALSQAAAEHEVLPGDLERSAALARRFGAAQYITGSVVRVGGKIQISASVYRTDGKPRARRSRTVPSEAEVFPAVDSLAAALLETELTHLPDVPRGEPAPPPPPPEAGCAAVASAGVLEGLRATEQVAMRAVGAASPAAMAASAITQRSAQLPPQPCPSEAP